MGAPFPTAGGGFSLRRGVPPPISAPVQTGRLVCPCRGHTFSPAAERKYQRDAAREGLFTETPLSGLSLLSGKSQLRDDVLDLYSLLSFCCRSAVPDVTRTRLRSLGVRFAGLVIEEGEPERGSPFWQALFPRHPSFVFRLRFPVLSSPFPGDPRGPAGSLGRAKGILKGKPLRNGFPLSAPLPTFPAWGKWAAGGITASRPAPGRK